MVTTGDMQPQTLRAMLDLIREGARTRAQLVTETGLGRKVVASLLDRLIQSGLVIDGGSAPSTGGRAPRELRFNPEVGHILVAEINATRLGVGICNLDGTILTSRYEPADTVDNSAQELSHVERLFDELLAERPADAPPMLGIGLALLGPVDSENGRILALPIMSGWRDYPVRERFAGRYGLPVWIENGVNLMAFGEARGGLGRGLTDLVFIEIGRGIGAGMVSGGILTRGASDYAGEIGHLVMSEDSTDMCWCGNTGCLTRIAGGLAVVERAEATVHGGVLHDVMRRNGHLTVPDLTSAAIGGDAAAIRLIAEAGRLIGRAVAVLVTVNNPQLVVIGGELSASGETLLSTIRENAYRYSLPLSARGLRIELSESSDAAALRGAAFLVVDHLLAPEQLGRLGAIGEPHPMA